LGLALHMFGVYSLSVYFLSRLSPLEFFRRIKTVMLTAFSTSSSAATLPTALRVGEENLRVPREINSFVLTVGATANQNGTALYEGVTVLFLAQLAGVDLSIGKKLIHAMVAYLYCSTMSKHQATWARFPTTAYLNGGATFQVVNGLAGGGELHGPSFITLKGSRDQATGSFVVRAEDAASEVQLL